MNKKMHAIIPESFIKIVSFRNAFYAYPESSAFPGGKSLDTG